jgi:hypothetical protein
MSITAVKIDISHNHTRTSEKKVNLDLKFYLQLNRPEIHHELEL